MSRRAAKTAPDREETDDRTVQVALLSRRRAARVRALTGPRRKAGARVRGR